MFIIIILLNAFMLLPIAFNVGKLKTISLEDYLPEAAAMINDDFLKAINQLEVKDRQFVIPELRKVVMSDSQELLLMPNEGIISDLSEEKNYFILLPREYIIKLKQRPAIQQPYVEPESLKKAEDSEGLKAEIGHQWFISNRPAIVVINVINIALLLLTSQFLLIIGIAFLLSLMRLWQNCDIQNFKEALTITLYAMGGPTLLAMIGGLIILNPMEMMSFQGLAFIGVLIWTYWVTHFNDDYVRNNKRGVKSGRN